MGANWPRHAVQQNVCPSPTPHAAPCSAVLEAPERSPSPDTPRRTMQAWINAAAAALVLTYPAHAAEKFRVLFSIFDLPFANSDKIKADLAGQTFHRNRKKKIPARSSAALDLTVCKKKVCAKNVNIDIKRFDQYKYIRRYSRKLKDPFSYVLRDISVNK